MADEAQNRARAEAAGFRLVSAHRLPSSAWWDSYYGPLQRRIAALSPAPSSSLEAVIAETRREMDLFARHGDDYGYAFLVLAAA
jgi:hypothetical protein